MTTATAIPTAAGQDPNQLPDRVTIVLLPG